MDPFALLPDPVDAVQTCDQAMDALAGGPEGRNGRDAQQSCGGIVIGTDDQTLRSPHQGTGQHALQQPDQIRGRQGRESQGGQDQQQRGKNRDGQKVAGRGGIDGNLHGRNVQDQILQPLHPFCHHHGLSPPLRRDSLPQFCRNRSRIFSAPEQREQVENHKAQ